MPEIISLNDRNIANEHICCAIADKKCSNGYEAKKRWLSNQFANGYKFKKLDVRGKVFIQYVPAEFAWSPISAPGYMFIDCFWVSGQFKGHGYGKALLDECINDSADMDGITVLVADKKKPFMSDKKFFELQGFEVADSAPPYFELMFKRFNKNAPLPKFKDCAKHAECDTPHGLSVYYTDGCPFNDYYVNIELKKLADEKNIPLVINNVKTMEQAQNHFVPFTIYSVFQNGKFVTQQILSKSTFEKMIAV